MELTLMERNTVKVYSTGRMDPNIKDSLTTTISMELEFINGLMEESTKGNG
jgi:hypothetical protein